MSNDCSSNNSVIMFNITYSGMRVGFELWN